MEMKKVDILGINYVVESGYHPTLDEKVLKRVTILTREKKETRVGVYTDVLFQKINKSLSGIYTEALRTEFDDFIDIEVLTNGSLRLVVELPYDLSWISAVEKVETIGSNAKNVLKDWQVKLINGETINGKGGAILNKFRPGISRIAKKAL
ncbi:MAG: hypothetical protein DDT40_00468 [candidate division WS2 bacterium]|nr:hypothetical protein [Candidatus Psychracetigena formicireducens]MBT9150300.1 hypothetical protein [Candidatus Psychracetigena formicireducens]